MRNSKNQWVAAILSFLFGVLGIDRFYLGYIGMGLLKLLTGGLFGILWIIDFIRILTGSIRPADGSEYVNGNTQMAAMLPYENLNKLKELLDSGAITRDEYAKLKADVLNKL